MTNKDRMEVALETILGHSTEQIVVSAVRVIKDSHAAGRREAWEKMRYQCDCYEHQFDGRCSESLVRNGKCEYDACPLLPDKG